MKRGGGKHRGILRKRGQSWDDVRSERTIRFSNDSDSRDGFDGRERNGFYGMERSPSPPRRRKSNRKAKRADEYSKDNWGFGDDRKARSARAVRNWKSSESSSGFHRDRGKRNRNRNRDVSSESSDVGFGFGRGSRNRGRRDRKTKSVRVSGSQSWGYPQRNGKKSKKKGKQKAGTEEWGRGGWESRREDKARGWGRSRSSSPSGWGGNYGKRSHRRESRDRWGQGGKRRGHRYNKRKDSYSSTSSVGTGTAIRLRNRVAIRYRSKTVLATAGGFDAAKESAKWNHDGRLRSSSDRRRHEPKPPRRNKRKGIFAMLSCF
ncbi:hypothetical protein BWQ96_06221 [Gracilariopsis chorda]|uniref:Uncharacterized protein n=1 Tax=Gracilariopsis chorda TaxID=448386 RepID=A0A2V3IPI1_9FLOR|nr:hypothetical protein BWQ96_06221 [Gracilariopsis chorda]|eukprot:PXF43988.1 hypothetical protein BWQ96_06221 [Gracilariopsis chorda]